MVSKVISSGIVNAFNAMAGVLEKNVAPHIPQKKKLNGGLDFLSEKLPAEGFKNFVVKPLILQGEVFRFIGQPKSFPLPMRLAHDAKTIKAYIGGIEIVTKLPKLVSSLSSPVRGIEASRIYAKTNGHKYNGPELTPLQAVSSRLSSVASWVISAGDFVSFASHCEKPFPKPVTNLTSWISAGAGGYMAAQSLWTELSFARGTWAQKGSDVRTEEKYYSCLNLAASATNLFASVVGVVALYDKNSSAAWLGRLQFFARVGTTLMPMAQICAKAYMDRVVWNPATSAPMAAGAN